MSKCYLYQAQCIVTWNKESIVPENTRLNYRVWYTIVVSVLIPFRADWYPKAIVRMVERVEFLFSPWTRCFIFVLLPCNCAARRASSAEFLPTMLR